MPSILPGFEYDIFISYRHNDNRSGWVTGLVNAGKRSYFEIYKGVKAESLAARTGYYGAVTLDDVVRLLDVNVERRTITLKWNVDTVNQVFLKSDCILKFLGP